MIAGVLLVLFSLFVTMETKHDMIVQTCSQRERERERERENTGSLKVTSYTVHNIVNCMLNVITVIF